MVDFVENKNALFPLHSRDSVVEYIYKMEMEGKVMKYANQMGYSDINPCEVVKVVSDKTIEIRYMDTEALPWDREFHPGGFFGHTSNQRDQKWKITSNEENPVIRIRLSKNKGWQDKWGNRYKLADEPIKFYDFNF